jgi:hypothetical protein
MWLKHYKLNEHEEKLLNMSRNEFDDYMLSKYPNQFKNRIKKENDKYIMPMHFGFEIGKGWRHVLDSLCSKLQLIEDKMGVICVFEQIKEKFGSARFYFTEELKEGIELNETDFQSICNIINDLVNYYSEYCDYICDELGTNLKPNEKIIAHGWYYGCGIEGFLNRFSDCQKKIDIANESYKIQCKINSIKDNVHMLCEEDLQEIEELINRRKEEFVKERALILEKFKNNENK